MVIRDAQLDDLNSIFEIYNEQILHGTATFDTIPVVDRDTQERWFDMHKKPNRPAIVAVDDARVIGWATLSDWSTKCAYARAAEVSVYVAANERGKGIGRRLLTTLTERAESSGVCVLMSRIESKSEASLKLHDSLGFQAIGTMRRVGEKFGRVLDVVLMDLHLDDEN